MQKGKGDALIPRQRTLLQIEKGHAPMFAASPEFLKEDPGDLPQTGHGM